MLRVHSSLLVAFSLVALAASQPAVAASPHPVIPGFERFHTSADSDLVEGGRLLLGELNCLACHGKAAGKQAPILDRLGARVKPEYLRRFLSDPHASKPGTRMPNVMAGLSPKERDERVDALVHFLLSASKGPPQQAFPRYGDSKSGEELFHSVGCVACHDSSKKDVDPLRTSKPLGDLAAKYTLPSLKQFLRDPHQVRPSGRMPSLNLSAQEAGSIAAYLLKLPEVATLRYSYYEGSWQKIPDFAKLKPKKIGAADEINVAVKSRGDQFGLRFEGRLTIDDPGEYTFHLRSDDGSRLVIDGKVVVDNDGVHPPGDKSGKAKLTAGPHAVIVDFFEQGGGEEVSAQYEGPGVKRQPLHNAMQATDDTPKLESLAFEVDAVKAKRGRELFATVGCASCHVLTEGDKVVASKLTTEPLASLNPTAGCLSGAANQKTPDFALTPRQRKAIQEALVKPGRGDDRGITRTMTALNCFACHERNKRGGVEEERNRWFRTTTPEMGDEGRIPPSLTGVGAKLTSGWLERLVVQGGKDRPYMLARMPKFGGSLTGLAKALAAHDTIQPPPKVAFEEPLRQVKADGRRMVGDKGFSCVKCHKFGRFPATGIQSIDLRIMSQRLRKDWFLKYMMNPQLFRPRTRMPSAWPEEGPSLLADVLGGDSQQQVAAVWAYLSDGPRTKIPSGLEIKSMELIPIDEAIIYRNFIQDAGPRAIAVGYPEGVNLAYDAENLRLALLWKGRFIDASRHWSGRGQGFQGPAGEAVLKFPNAVEFAELEDESAPWPKQSARELKQRFRGYGLTKDQRPTFLYSIGEARVQDFVNTALDAGNVFAKRQLTVRSKASGNQLWMRVGVAKQIQSLGDGGFDVGGDWNVRVVGAETKTRKIGGDVELLVRVSGETAEFTLEYSW